MVMLNQMRDLGQRFNSEGRPEYFATTPAAYEAPEFFSE